MPYHKVTKVREIHDEASDTWVNEFVAPGAAGYAYALIPRDIQDVKTVRAHLLRKGAVRALLTDEAIAEAIADEVDAVRRAARTGWRNGGAVFVSHGHVAGDTGDVRVLPPENKLVAHLEPAGDDARWKKLAKVARYSTAMTVVLCATFAAPLLRLLNRQSFAVVLYGPSRIGKTTAQLLGASAMGFANEEDLPTFKATEAGLLAAAMGFNDLLLPINEVGTAPGKKKDKYDAIYDATYALTSGHDVIRHPIWNGGNASDGAGFRLIAMISSEHAPDAWAARKGENRDAGETARMFGLSALYDGIPSIFDQPPEDVDGADFPEWEKKQFAKLKKRLPEQCGVAFSDFMEKVVEDHDAVRDLAADLVAAFEGAVATAGMSPVQRDIVANFGVLYAGGMIAIDKGVLPFVANELIEDVKRACRATLDGLSDPTAELRADLATLKGHLGSGAVVDWDKRTAKQATLMQQADGWHVAKGTGREFVIRGTAFMGLFTSEVRARHVLEHLDDEGYLAHGRERTTRRSNEWAQRQVTWPNGSRPRSFTIFLPGGLDDLDL